MKAPAGGVTFPRRRQDCCHPGCCCFNRRQANRNGRAMAARAKRVWRTGKAWSTPTTQARWGFHLDRFNPQFATLPEGGRCCRISGAELRSSGEQWGRYYHNEAWQTMISARQLQRQSPSVDKTSAELGNEKAFLLEIMTHNFPLP